MKMSDMGEKNKSERGGHGRSRYLSVFGSGFHFKWEN